MLRTLELMSILFDIGFNFVDPCSLGSAFDRSYVRRSSAIPNRNRSRSVCMNLKPISFFIHNYESHTVFELRRIKYNLDWSYN